MVYDGEEAHAATPRRGHVRDLHIRQVPCDLLDPFYTAEVEGGQRSKSGDGWIGKGSTYSKAHL